jgi:magnesium-transporting ATPase (P-type)
MDKQKIWNLSPEDTIKKLQTSLTGLSKEEITQRQKQYGLNILHKRNISPLQIFIRQFKGNPLIIILLVATAISYALGQHNSSFYIFGITILSLLLGFWNEYSSEKTVADLLKKITANAVVMRNNEKYEIPVTQIAIGDVVLLSPGTIIPA